MELLGRVRPAGEIIQTYAAKIGNTCKNRHLRLPFTVLVILISPGRYPNLFLENGLRHFLVLAELDQPLRKNRHFSYTLLASSDLTCII